ncbi:MAG: ligase-associated DNA damage response endonuclease PdeM, partial [Bacteroidota bacterium]
MKIIKEQITIRNESIILTNQRALFWEREQVLVLSDLHVGKTAHFRKHGIPIPDDILKEDLNRLSALIHYFNPLNIYIVGDLFHAEANMNMEYFHNWQSQYGELKMTLIKGNHDKLPEYWISKLDLIVETKITVAPFFFVHDPSEDKGDYFAISGHIHPGVLIKGRGRQKLKLPCYAITEDELILPAFSKFTGLNSKYG